MSIDGNMKHHPLRGDGASLTDQPAVRYQGARTLSGPLVARIHADGGGSLPTRLDLRNHSPDGFEWGYGGSGPAQLALAILADAIGEREAQKHYQEFKWKFIAMLDQEKPWEITREQIIDWIGQQRGQGG